MSHDLIISGNFYFDGLFRSIEVAVTNGKITAIGKDLRGKRRMELAGAILPAGTDVHVHFRDPGETEKEDFSTGTASALSGGTTTIFDMPNNRIPVADRGLFEEKLQSVRKKAFCDFGLYSLFTGNNAADIDQRSSGVKVFLGGSTNSVVTQKMSGDQIDLLNSLGVPVVFHAEDEICLKTHKLGQPETLRDHNQFRPEKCENIAVNTMNALNLDKRMIAHISSPKTLVLAEKRLIKEVTPHHILLNDEMNLGPWGKVNPPLRSRNIMEELMRLYLSGQFNLISSDHAPHTEYEKGEFQSAPSGIIGVETRIPLLLALFSKKFLNIDTLVKTAISFPAEIMGIKKGKVSIGYFADFINFDPSDITKIDETRLHSKLKVTPFNGFDAIFPKNVIMRGESVVEDGELIDDHVGEHVKELETVDH